MFAATRVHVRAFRDAFPDATIDDRDGTLANVERVIPEVVDIERRTVSRMPLFEHQRRAINTAFARDYYAFFHDMGLGKSASIINIAAELFAHGKITRAIVITTKRVVPQFLNEQIPLHFPHGVSYRAAAFPSALANRQFKYPDNNLLIAVASYGALQSTKQSMELLAFARAGETAIFLDESHNIKTFTTKRVEHLRKMRPYLKRRYLFSGEPQPLGIIDLFSQFYFLDENIIGHASLTSFKNQYCVMGGFENREIRSYRNVEELKKSIAPHCEYLKIANVVDMPEQTFITRKIDPTPEQKQIYTRLKDDFVIAIERATNENDTEIKSKFAKNAAAKFIAMQQVAAGFFYADPTNDDEKRGELVVINDERANFIAEELVQGEKTVVFCRFHASLDSLARAMTKANIKFVEFSGRLSNVDNENAKQAFLNDPSVLVFCATAASGSTGLNLQVASRTVYFENSFSFGDRAQSEARTWRVGQKNHCVYFDIEMLPIDKLVRANLLKKQDLSQQLQSIEKLRALMKEL